jgi:DNA-directed RNA polymerase specialized sigma24 family protein
MEPVEVLGAYSNPSGVSRLQRLLAGQDTDRVSDRSSSIVSRKRKQAQVRLTDDEIDVVIAGYEAGLGLNELSSAFGADRRTLANRLVQRGIPRRSRRLADEQIQEAIALYTDGWSLARIAEHVDVYPESIRYRLQRAGVVLRPRPGWRA